MCFGASLEALSLLGRMLRILPEERISIDDALHHEFLRKFKQLVETGEIATTVGQPAGRKLSYSRKFDVAARKMAEAN